MTYARRKLRSKIYTTGRTSWVPNLHSTLPNCCHHRIFLSRQQRHHRPKHSVSICKMSSLFRVLNLRYRRNLPLHDSLDRVAPVLKQGTVSRRFPWRVHDLQRTSVDGSLHPRIGGRSLSTEGVSVDAVIASMQVNVLWTTRQAALRSTITI
jgi:hypothetical protein